MGGLGTGWVGSMAVALPIPYPHSQTRSCYVGPYRPALQRFILG